MPLRLTLFAGFASSDSGGWGGGWFQYSTSSTMGPPRIMKQRQHEVPFFQVQHRGDGHRSRGFGSELQGLRSRSLTRTSVTPGFPFPRPFRSCFLTSRPSREPYLLRSRYLNLSQPKDAPSEGDTCSRGDGKSIAWLASFSASPPSRILSISAPSDVRGWLRVSR